jgi:hypothetical protein
MRVRALLLSCVAATTAMAVGAQAAPVKKACNLVADKAGDVNNDITVEGQKAPASFPASESLDLVGGDLASNGTSITGVLKLAKIDPDEQAVINRRYVLKFKPAGSKYPLLLAVLVDATGETFFFGWFDPATGTYNYPGTTATGAITGNTISISAKLADMAAVPEVGKVKPGTRISGIEAYAFRRYPAPSATVGVPPSAGAGFKVAEADAATSKQTYVAGQASCVKLG